MAVQPVRCLEKNCYGKGACRYGWEVGFSEAVGCFMEDRFRAWVGFLGRCRLGRSVVVANVEGGCSREGEV